MLPDSPPQVIPLNASRLSESSSRHHHPPFFLTSRATSIPYNMKIKSIPFSLRDIIFTPRHVRLACDPPRVKKASKSSKTSRSLKRHASVASSTYVLTSLSKHIMINLVSSSLSISYSFHAPPERPAKSKSAKRRPRTYSQPLASGCQTRKPIGSLPLKDTLQMKRFSLMRRRRTLSFVDFDGNSC